MDLTPPARPFPRLPRVLALAALLLLAAGGLVLAAQGGRGDDLPQHEFRIARLMYVPHAGNDRFAWRPWWAIDYPEAEYHFTQGIRRLTRLHSADDSIHLRATDPRLFDYPWLFAQQVGRWYLSDEEAAALREYLLRGGFLVADDFHGAYEYEVFMQGMGRVFPDLPVIDLTEDDPLLHVVYDISRRTQIPGKRHLYRDGSGQIRVAPDGTPPMWKGILDEHGRLMVVMNFNMDMGDSWEHADDPDYPQEMTALGYRFGINYILYAMTH
ncbi:MAG: DUF4159 domain-containing protein [Pseudomonadota bacterium]|jgi:hypothetical protein